MIQEVLIVDWGVHQVPKVHQAFYIYRNNNNESKSEKVRKITISEEKLFLNYCRHLLKIINIITQKTGT
jgi:hypothetical protein